MSAGPCWITLCRGCCCGTARKHPEVDHEALADRLLDGVGEHGRVRISDCLGSCAQSNVVVVGPSSAAQRGGARPRWIRQVLDRATVDEIVAWVIAGGPGVAPAPRRVEALAFRPTP